MGEYTDLDQIRLEQICNIITSAIEGMDYELMVDKQLRYDTTPDDQKLAETRIELKEIQKQFFEFDWTYREVIQASIRDFRNHFIKYQASLKSSNELDFFRENKHYFSWQEGFIKSLIMIFSDENGNNPYLEFDYDFFDSELVEEKDVYWFLNIEEYLPLPDIELIIKCVQVVSDFRLCFEAYHTFLNGDVSNVAIKSQRGFDTKYSDIQIEHLFEQIRGVLIDKDTQSEHFKAIFRNEPLPRNFNKINWRANTNLLAYFVDSFFFGSKENSYSSEKHIWAKAKNCFMKAGSLKQAKDLFLNNMDGKPKGYERVDSILKHILTIDGK